MNQGIEILIAEDSPTQAFQLQHVLEQHGYRVTVARDGHQALDKLRAGEARPTLVISDIMMPEMNGYELCCEIKNDEGLKDIPVVLLTSLSDPHDIVRGLQCGADNFLTKPYEEKTLLSRIQYILLNREVRRGGRTQMGMEVVFNGQQLVVTPERQQILDLLISSYETAVQKNLELRRVQGELKALNERLEEKVEERTAELKAEMAERRRAEESRLQLAAIVESSDDAIMSASLDLTFTSWNRGAERLFGYSAEEMLGKPITLLMPPERQKEALTLTRRVVDEQRVINLETVRVREDGSPIDIAYTYSPIRDSTGAVVGVSAIGQDITDRKRAEAAIRESEEQFRALVGNVPGVIFRCALDADWTMEFLSEAMADISGYPSSDFIGNRVRTFTSVVHPEDRAPLEKAVGDGSSYSVEYRILHANGDVRWVLERGQAVRDAQGQVWLTGAIFDVSDRKRAEAERERLLADLAERNERLLELDRLKDEFIALVSHELRTPLTSIRGYTELLLDGEAGALGDDQRQFLGVVERNAHRLLHLVGDLLFLAQVEAGKLVLDVGAVDLGAIASESVEAARPQADTKGITLTLATGPVPLVAGDRARIGQLLDNLVSNAIKFTPESGRVDVRVRTLRKRAVVEVRDSGIGIPANERQHLFQRFYRTSTATEQAIQGTGLGLAISKAIVDAHDGRITLTSEEDVGTTFRVELPLGRFADVSEREEVAS